MRIESNRRETLGLAAALAATPAAATAVALGGEDAAASAEAALMAFPDRLGRRTIILVRRANVWRILHVHASNQQF